MRSLTPEFILKKLAQHEDHGQFAAVVLFVDTSGFTPLTTALLHHGTEGAEIIAQLLARLFTPLVEIVYHYGGFIAGFAGDAFKAIFPGMAAVSYQRALTAAWQIRQQMRQQPVQPTRFGDFPFAIKVTVADGNVAWRIWQGAETGLAQQAAPIFGGDALEQALAADPFAMAGEVVMTPAVAAQVPQAQVTLEAVGSHFRLGAWPAVPALPRAVSNDVPLAPPIAALAMRFFPADLLTGQSQGEFRQVVTLFINVQTLPSDREGGTFAATLFHLLAQYGGYLCRIGQIGDKDQGGTLLLFWGAPTSHEQDAARALHFVLAFARAVRSLSLSKETDGSIDAERVKPYPLRAGITTQLAYAGFVGSPRREEYTCYGAHVNLAARQMVMADWGEIWLDEETARVAGGAFECVPHGLFKFKGFREERTVYRLRGRREAGLESFYQGAMVGRQAELAHLQAALAPLFAGQFAGVLTITGEAGLGKSRLVHELQQASYEGRVAGGELLHLPPVPRHPLPAPQWFRCQTDEILRQPLNPFRYWLRSYFNQATSADEATNKAAFMAKLDELLVRLEPKEGAAHEQAKSQTLKAEIDRTRSFLGALVDLDWPASLYTQVEPQLRFENTLAALKTLILAESLCRPVVLHLEDAHWLDQESRSMLSRLTHNVTAYPLAVILTTRRVEENAERGREEADEPEGLKLEGPQLTIRLSTLTAGEITALAMAQLQGPPAPALVTLLGERAEGNPFFAEQLLRYLQEQGWLTQGPDGWQLRADQATTTLLPKGARALLVARLDQLPHPVKEVVQTAAVLGREFDTQVLAQMLADDTTLAAKLAVADRAAIWSAMSQARYLFRHALLREAAYDMQLRARLRTLHRQAGEALQALFAERLDSYYVDLAYHYDRAEIAEQAATWYGRAGEQAAHSYANRDAEVYFSRALALTPAGQAAACFKLLLGREAVYAVIGQVDAQRADITRMEKVAQQLADATSQAQVALRSADQFRMTGDYESALSATEHAAALANQTNSLQLMGSIQHQWGRVYWEQGNYGEGKRHLEQALQLAQASQYLHGEAKSLTDLGSIHFYQSEYALAEKQYTAALALYQTVGERKGEIGSLAMLGTLANETANYEVSLVYYQKAQTLCHTIGYAYGEAFVLGNLGMNYICVGQYETARNCLLQAIESCRERKDRHNEGVYLDSLAVIYLQQGDVLSAIREADQALAIQQAIGDRRFAAYSLTYKGEALRRLGDLPAAKLAYEQALTIRRQLREEKLTPEILIGLAQIMLAQGQLAAVQAHVTTVLQWIEAHGVAGIEFPIQLYLACYHLQLTLGESERARTRLATGYQLLQSRAEKIQDAQLRQSFLEAVPFNRELALIWRNRFGIY